MISQLLEHVTKSPWHTDFCLARQIDSQVIHGWNYIIPLYIDWKMWSLNCCCLSGPFARRCVGNNAAQRAPTYPPATLTGSSRNWFGGYSNAFPRLIRLPWVVRFPGQIMKAQLTLKIRGYSFIFILYFSYPDYYLFTWYLQTHNSNTSLAILHIQGF